MSNFQKTAQAFADAFETSTRDGSSERYYRLKEGSPEWMTDAIHSAHGDRMPDDWIYEHCSHIVDRIAECDDVDSVDSCEIADAIVDIYTNALTAWLASHLDNVSLCDEAISEGLCDGSEIVTTLQRAQYMMLDRMCGELASAIRDAAESDESDDEIDEVLTARITVRTKGRPSAHYTPDDRARNGALDHDVEIALCRDGVQYRVIESEITLYNGTVDPSTPIDVWVAGPIVTWLRTLDKESYRAAVKSLGDGPGVETIEWEAE